MISYIGNRKDAAQFAADILQNSRLSLRSITITRRRKSGDYCVSIVTDTSSEDTVEKWVLHYCEQQRIISKQNT
jgi:hypothetical protein